MANIGDRIQMLSNHWCRASQKGVVVPLPDGLTELPDGRVLVKFENKGVGIGGEFLFVDGQDFKIIETLEDAATRQRKKALAR